MIFERGKHYRFVQTDCAGEYIPGLSNKNGSIVEYVEPLRKGFHYVRCPLGHKFRVHDDELHHLQPKGLNQTMSQEFQPSDKIICISEDLEQPCWKIEFGVVYTAGGMVTDKLVNVLEGGNWLSQRFELVRRQA
jgi:hypothetical protein